jgi:hypothetical protein
MAGLEFAPQSGVMLNRYLASDGIPASPHR